MAPKVKGTWPTKTTETTKSIELSKMKPRKSKKRQYSGELATGPETTNKSQRKSYDEITSDMLMEMGLSFLGDNSNDSLLQPTPTNIHSNFANQLTIAPPKVKPNNARGQSATTTTANNNGAKRLSFGFQNFTESSTNGHDYFAQIVDEVVLQIFKWLPKTTLVRCARVCKRWQRLAFDETLWRRIDLGGRHVKPGVIGQLLSRGVHIMRLSKATINQPLYLNSVPPSPDSSFHEDSVSFSQPKCSVIQYLDMSMVTTTVNVLVELLGTCRHLRKLSLENCLLSDEVCNQIAANHSLQCINLSMCEGLTKKGLVAILKGCPNLKDLNIAWTELDPLTLFAIPSNIPKSIERLNISGFRNILTNDVVINLVERCTKLQELDLSDSSMLTGTTINVLLQLPSLQILGLSRCYNITSNILSLRNLFTLRSLDLYGIFQDSAIATLEKYLPNVDINKRRFSTVARPTTGIHCTSIWGLRVRD